jgi:hypothetical protein
VAQHPTNASPGTTSAQPAAHYAERLIVPWWWWPFGLAVAALLAAEVFLGAPGFAKYIPYLVTLPLTGGFLWYVGRLRVAVADGEFRVDDAHIPVRYVSQVGVLTGEAKREAVGPRGDPNAFVVLRPWVPGAVLLVLDDPADPTPYWVVSARHPTRLAEALQAAIRAAPRPPTPESIPD